MSRVRVQLYGRQGYADIETDPTTRAIIGVNVYNPDGSLWVPPAPVDPNDPLEVYWREIREIPPNIVALAALTGAGFAYRRADGTWQLRASGRAVFPFSFGEASPIEIYAPAEDGFLTVIRLVIDTPFDGAGATLEVGDDTTADLYMLASENDPAVAASYQVHPDVAVSTGEGVYLTITPGTGATAGAGRAIIEMIPIAES